MSALIAEDETIHEVEFVWLEGTNRLDYVGQSPDRLPTRRGKPAWRRDGRMAGEGGPAVVGHAGAGHHTAALM